MLLITVNVVRHFSTWIIGRRMHSNNRDGKVLPGDSPVHHDRDLVVFIVYIKTPSNQNPNRSDEHDHMMPVYFGSRDNL